MNESLRIAELLCARLCHDLSGPLGALIGVLEVAREEQPDSETLAIAEDTAVELGQRLKLLRAAWGLDGDDLDVMRLRGFADCLSSSRRVRLDLAGLQPDAEFPPPVARIILNLVLLAAESLPGGGIVAVSGSPSSAILVTISGPRAAWPAGFAVWLNDEAAAWEAMIADPRRIQAPLTALLARGLGLRLSMLMPAGPLGDAEVAPPLLLTLGDR
ncbi:MAG TPA: histidine phosphotransferase family protein [Acetobacteraceae bacterium]|jgi:histidine phosphotransferase ChpT